MEREYYREYYDLERTHWWFRARKNILRDHINDITRSGRNLNILNIGASTGHSSEMLSEFGDVTSSEYDQECIDFAQKRLGIQMVQADVTRLPFESDTYDLVCAFDVLEHVEDDRKGMQELQRVCKPGGIVCVTVPAFMFLWSSHDEVNHHFRRYTKPQLLSLFKGDGKLLYHSYFMFFLFFPVSAFRVLKGLLGDKHKKGHNGAGSDFSSNPDKGGFSSKIFYRVFNLESAFITRKAKFPFGVSVLATWQKAN